MRVVMVKGTKITCPDCDLHIATANKDILAYTVMSCADLDSEIGPLWGKKMNCPRCCASYGGHPKGKGGTLHTEEGWKS